MYISRRVFLQIGGEVVPVLTVVGGDRSDSLGMRPSTSQRVTARVPPPLGVAWAGWHEVSVPW